MTIVKVLCRQLKATFEPPEHSDAGSIFRLTFPQHTFSRAATAPDK
jgi:hypothetical protein